MAPSLKVLALDLSTRTGWACGEPWGPPVGGVWKLGRMKRDGIGRCCSALAAALGAAIEAHAPDLVIYEAPLPSHAKGIGRDTMVARLQYALCGVTEMICLECGGVTCEEASADEARKLVFGRRLRGGSDEIKSTVYDWAVASGFDPFDHNHADALVLLRYRHTLGRMRVMAGAGSA